MRGQAADAAKLQKAAALPALVAATGMPCNPHVIS